MSDMFFVVSVSVFAVGTWWVSRINKTRDAFIYLTKSTSDSSGHRSDGLHSQFNCDKKKLQTFYFTETDRNWV